MKYAEILYYKAYQKDMPNRYYTNDDLNEIIHEAQMKLERKRDTITEDLDYPLQ